jgi:uncharacterized protein YPO0396
MHHAHSIIIHRDDHGNAQIWVLDYEDGRQVGNTREIPSEHAAYRALLSAINAVTDGSGVSVEREAIDSAADVLTEDLTETRPLSATE